MPNNVDKIFLSRLEDWSLATECQFGSECNQTQIEPEIRCVIFLVRQNDQGNVFPSFSYNMIQIPLSAHSHNYKWRVGKISRTRDESETVTAWKSKQMARVKKNNERRNEKWNRTFSVVRMNNRKENETNKKNKWRKIQTNPQYITDKRCMMVCTIIRS